MPTSVTSQQHIKAPVAQVWQALTTKEQLKEWYFDIPDFELKAGAVFNFYEPGEERRFLHRCVIKEIIPNQKFSHTWTHPDYTPGETLVTWELAPKNDGTDVTLVHSGLENLAGAGPEFAPANYQTGWDALVKGSLKNYVYGIRKKKYSIDINAPAAKVWENLWNDTSYRQWTGAFTHGSYYTGEMKPGARVHFLAPGRSGMYSDVIFFAPAAHALFQHIGVVKDGAELPVDDAAEKWTRSLENYTLKEKNGKTRLDVEVDLSPTDIGFMDKAFPKALSALKQLCEAG